MWPRPQGKAPLSCSGKKQTWDYDEGDWFEVDSDDDVCFAGSKRSLPLPLPASTKPKRAAAESASSPWLHLMSQSSSRRGRRRLIKI